MLQNHFSGVQSFVTDNGARGLRQTILDHFGTPGQALRDNVADELIETTLLGKQHHVFGSGAASGRLPHGEFTALNVRYRVTAVKRDSGTRRKVQLDARRFDTYGIYDQAGSQIKATVPVKAVVKTPFLAKVFSFVKLKFGLSFFKAGGATQTVGSDTGGAEWHYYTSSPDDTVVYRTTGIYQVDVTSTDASVATRPGQPLTAPGVAYIEVPAREAERFEAGLRDIVDAVNAGRTGLPATRWGDDIDLDDRRPPAHIEAGKGRSMTAVDILGGAGQVVERFEGLIQQARAGRHWSNGPRTPEQEHELRSELQMTFGTPGILAEQQQLLADGRLDMHRVEQVTGGYEHLRATLRLVRRPDAPVRSKVSCSRSVVRVWAMPARLASHRSTSQGGPAVTRTGSPRGSRGAMSGPATPRMSPCRSTTWRSGQIETMNAGTGMPSRLRTRRPSTLS